MAARKRLAAEDAEYLAAHPVARDIVKAIVVGCLTLKPDNVVEFVRKFAPTTAALRRSVALTKAACNYRPEGYTLEEVGQHATKEDAWIAVNGKVYEVTHFFDEHPGGVKPLSFGIGKDATAMFNKVHSYVNPDKRLERFYLGPLRGGKSEGDDEAKVETAAAAVREDVALPDDAFRSFRVMHNDRVSSNAVLLTLELPGKPLGLRPCEHLLVKTASGVRPYTPVSRCDETEVFRLAVKVYPDGVVSADLGRLRPGDTVQVKPLRRSFLYDPGRVTIKGRDPVPVKRFNLIAGGSGITPMLQVMEAAAQYNDGIEVCLLYGVKTTDEIMMAERLQALETASGGAVRCHYFLSQAAEDPTDPAHHQGRITAAHMADFLFPPSNDTFVCVCGPKPFVDALSTAAADSGHGNIHCF